MQSPSVLADRDVSLSSPCLVCDSPGDCLTARCLRPNTSDSDTGEHWRDAATPPREQGHAQPRLAPPELPLARPRRRPGICARRAASRAHPPVLWLRARTRRGGRAGGIIGSCSSTVSGSLGAGSRVPCRGRGRRGRRGCGSANYEGDNNLVLRLGLAPAQGLAPDGRQWRRACGRATRARPTCAARSSLGIATRSGAYSRDAGDVLFSSQSGRHSPPPPRRRSRSRARCPVHRRRSVKRRRSHSVSAPPVVMPCGAEVRRGAPRLRHIPPNLG